MVVLSIHSFYRNMFTCPKCRKEWSTFSKMCHCGEEVLYIPNELKNKSFIEYENQGIDAVKDLIKNHVKSRHKNIDANINQSTIDQTSLPSSQHKSKKIETTTKFVSQSNQKTLNIIFTLMGLISLLSFYLKFYPPSFIKNFKNNSTELSDSKANVGNVPASIDVRQVSECFGTEPFWSLDISNGSLLFKHEELTMSLQKSTPKPAAGMSESYIALYQGKVIGQEKFMNVILTSDNQCSDNMSEDIHPVTAIILSGSDLYYGCCVKR